MAYPHLDPSPRQRRPAVQFVKQEAMQNTIKLLPFTLDGLKFAIRLESVIRVVLAIEVTPLPGAPEAISGAVNIYGEVVPVFDVRKRLGLSAKPTALSDHLIIAKTPKRLIGIMADSSEGVIECAEADIIPAGEVAPGLKRVDGIAKHNEGLIVIQDMDKFLSIEEEEVLGRAMNTQGQA